MGSAARFGDLKPLSSARDAWVRLNDSYLNIATDGAIAESRQPTRPWPLDEVTERACNADNHLYCSPDYWHLRKVLGVLRPARTEVVYDIGSGKGRFLCLAARYPVRRCIGLELREDLCEISRENLEHVRGRRAEFEIRCGDAATANVDEGTIYFLYNPFGPETLRAVLENIRLSVSENPRNVRLVYYNPVYESVLTEFGWLQSYHQFSTWQGYRAIFLQGRA
jgi:hypothetical protein